MSFAEQVMSKEKYLSIFSCQIEAIVVIILQIFFTACTVLKIEKCNSDIAQGNIQSHDVFKVVSSP